MFSQLYRYAAQQTNAVVLQASRSWKTKTFDFLGLNSLEERS